MSCRMLIAALATAAAILPGHAGPGQAPARSGQQPDLVGLLLGLGDGNGAGALHRLVPDLNR